MFGFSHLPRPEGYSLTDEQFQELGDTLSRAASKTICNGLQIYYGLGEDGSLPLFRRAPCLLFTFPMDFFEGLGEYYDTTDREIGKEIMVRKLARMVEKLKDPEWVYTFDLLEEYMYANLIHLAYQSHKIALEQGRVDYLDQAKGDMDIELQKELVDRFHFSEEEAHSLALHLCFLRNMGPGEYEDLCFYDEDYQDIWSMGFVRGIRIILNAGEYFGYSYDDAATIFEDIELKPPIDLIGTKAAYEILKEQQKKDMFERMEKGIPCWAPWPTVKMPDPIKMDIKKDEEDS